MKTNKDYILREVADEYVLIPTGKASQLLNGMIHLTQTAAFIWQRVDTADSLSKIISDVLDEFDVDEETATQDVYGFLIELFRRGIVEDIPEFADLTFEPSETEE